LLLPALALGDDQTVQTGGEVRLRGEARNDNDFSPKRYDHFNWIGLRARAHVAAFPNSNLEALVQIQYVNLLGGASSKTTDATFNRALNAGRPAPTGLVDAHQAYLRLKNIGDMPIHLKLGRQELIYGDQRLVGPADYNMVPRHFDAAKLEIGLPVPIAADLFASRMNQGPVSAATSAGPVDLRTDADKTQDLFGVYARTWWIPGVLVDGYELALRDGFAQKFGVESKTTSRHPAIIYTSGGRLQYLGLKGLDVTGEYAYQNGKRYDVPHRAQAWAVRGYYTLPVALSPGAGAEAVYASGDHDPKDGKSGEFENLFPTNHAKYGAMDLFGWRNIRAQHAIAGVSPMKTLSFFIDGWTFNLPEPRGPWKNAGGAVVLKGLDPKLPVVSHYAGKELDVTVRWAFFEQVAVLAHYGRFVPGTLVQQQAATTSTPYSTAEFAMAQIQANF
jgi:hypothetical protein